MFCDSWPGNGRIHFSGWVWISLAYLASIGLANAVDISINVSWTTENITHALKNAGGAAVNVVLDVSADDEAYRGAQLEALLDLQHAGMSGTLKIYQIRTSKESLANNQRAVFMCKSPNRLVLFKLIENIDMTMESIDLRSCDLQHNVNQEVEFNFVDVEIANGSLWLEFSPGTIRFHELRIVNNSALKVGEGSGTVSLNNFLVRDVATPANWRAAINLIGCSNPIINNGVFTRNSAPVLLLDRVSNPIADNIKVNFTSARATQQYSTPKQDAAVIITGSSAVELDQCVFVQNYVLPLQLLGMDEDTSGSENQGHMRDCAFLDNTNASPGQPSSVDVVNSGHTSRAPLKFQVQRCQFRRNRAVGSAAVHIDITAHINVTFSNCTFSNNLAEKCTPYTAFDLPGGGALAVQFRDSIAESMVNIVNNTVLSSNTGCRGGAMSVDFLNSSSENQVRITDSQFINNTVSDNMGLQQAIDTNGINNYGGAASFVFAQQASGNKVFMGNTSFSYNLAGYGGGIAVNIRDGASANQITISGNLVMQGKAMSSSCLFLCNGYREAHHCASEQYSQLARKYATTLGGGIFIQTQSTTHNNSISLSGCIFANNSAAQGGGLHAELSDRNPTPTLGLSSMVLKSNRAWTGAGMSLCGGGATLLHPSQESPAVTLTDVTFANNEALYRGSLSATSLRFSTHGVLNFSHCCNSALFLRDSIVDHYSLTTLDSNTGRVGAAAILLSSQLKVRPMSSILIINNAVSTIGGGFFTRQDEAWRPQQRNFRDTSNCFLDFVDDNGVASKWSQFRITFVENKAGVAGSAFYMADITPCAQLGGKSLAAKNFPDWMLMENNTIVPALKESGNLQEDSGGSSFVLAHPNDDDLLQSSWNICQPQAIPPGQLSDKQLEVASDIVRVAFLDKNKNNSSVSCAELEQSDGDREISTEVNPGIGMAFRAIACDQFDNEADAILRLFIAPHTPYNSRSIDKAHHLTHQLSMGKLESGQSSLKISTGSYSYLYASTLTTSKITFALTADVSKVQATVVAVALGTTQVALATTNVSLHGCPPGFQRRNKNGQYQCGCDSSESNSKSHIVSCDADAGQIVIYQGYWAASRTMPDDSTHLDVAQCPSGYCKFTKMSRQAIKVSVVNVMDPNSQCQDHRIETLCGDCSHDFRPSLAVYRGRCFPKDDCFFHIGLNIFVTFCCSLIIVLFLLWLDIPLSNDLKGLLFFAAVVRMLFQRTDDFMLYVNNDPWFSPYGFLRFLLELATFNFPGDVCIVNINDPIRAILVGYITPACVTIVVFIMHVGLSYPCFGLSSTWFFRKYSNGIANATWLFSYYFFQRTLELSAMLLQCVPVGKKTVFYWNGNQTCFSGMHAVGGGVAIFVLFLLAAFLAFIAFFSKRGAASPALHLIWKDMQHGLKKSCYFWWVYDLMRRVIIVSFYAPLFEDYPDWLKQIFITLACVFFLSVHLLVMPYIKFEDNATRDTAVMYGQRKYTIFDSIPGFLRRWRNSCNILEGIVLADMTFISLLSSSSVNPSANDNVHRQHLLYLLVLIPLLAFFSLFIYKIYRAFCHRLDLCNRCFPERMRRFNRRQQQRQQQTEVRRHIPLREELLPEGELSQSYGSIDASI